MDLALMSIVLLVIKTLNRPARRKSPHRLPRGRGLARHSIRLL